MKDLDVLVSGIEYKIKKLTALLEQLESEKKQLLLELAGLQNVIDEQNMQLKQLEERIFRMQTAQSLMNKKDVSNAKSKINELVREVDRCIALLNQ